MLFLRWCGFVVKEFGGGNWKVAGLNPKTRIILELSLHYTTWHNSKHFLLFQGKFIDVVSQCVAVIFKAFPAVLSFDPAPAWWSPILAQERHLLPPAPEIWIQETLISNHYNSTMAYHISRDETKSSWSDQTTHNNSHSSLKSLKLRAKHYLGKNKNGAFWC